MAPNFGSYNFQRNYEHSFTTCTLRVDARVPGWQREVSQVLSGIRGVNNLKIVPNGIVAVSGTVHPNLLLDRIWRTGRQAEIVCVQSGNCSNYLCRPGHGGFERGMADYDGCNGRSSSSLYAGYFNHLPSSSYNNNRPFAGLAESFMRPPQSPRWFWR